MFDVCYVFERDKVLGHKKTKFTPHNRQNAGPLLTSVVVDNIVVIGVVVVTVSGKSMIRSGWEQPWKAPILIVSRDGGSSTFDKLKHPEKVDGWMVFNKGGSLNVVNEQPKNAYEPISVTPSRASSFIVVRASQPPKAYSPIVLREDGSFTDLRDVHSSNMY